MVNEHFSTWPGNVWNAVFDQRKALLLPNDNLRGGLAFKASHCWHNWQLPGPIRSREQFHAGIQVGLWNPPCSRCRYFEIIEIQKGPTNDSITVKRKEDKKLGKSMGKPNLHAGAPSKEWIEVKSSLLPVGLRAGVNRRVKRVKNPVSHDTSVQPWLQKAHCLYPGLLLFVDFAASNMFGPWDSI